MPMVKYVQVVTFHDLPAEGLQGYTHKTVKVTGDDYIRKNMKVPGMFGYRALYCRTFIIDNLWIFTNTNFEVSIQDKERIINDAKALVAGKPVQAWSQHKTDNRGNHA